MYCSGQIVLFVVGDYYVIIVIVGAGLVELIFQGCYLVILYKFEEMLLVYLGKVFILWLNWIVNGCYCYQGQEYQLFINEYSLKVVIYGLFVW